MMVQVREAAVDSSGSSGVVGYKISFEGGITAASE